MTKVPLYFGDKKVAEDTLPLAELPYAERCRLFVEYLKLVAENRTHLDSAFNDNKTSQKLSTYIYPYKEEIFSKLLKVENELERMQIFCTLVYTQGRDLAYYMCENSLQAGMKLYLQENSPYPANITKLMQIYFVKNTNVRHWVRDEVQQVLAPYHLNKCKFLDGNKTSITNYFESSYYDYKYNLPIVNKRLKFSTHVLSQLLSYFYPRSIDAESFMQPGPGSVQALENLLGIRHKPAKLKYATLLFFDDIMRFSGYPIDAYHLSALEAHSCYFANYTHKKDKYVGKFYAYKLNQAQTQGTTQYDTH